MDDVNSSGEVELLSSINLKDDSVDMSTVENELKRIKGSKKSGESNIDKVLEDCITDSTVSISELVEYLNNTGGNSVKNNIDGPSNSVDNNSRNNVENGLNSKSNSGGLKVDVTNIVIKVNNEINISILGNKLSIIIGSQSNLIDNKLKVALFLMAILILIK